LEASFFYDMPHNYKIETRLRFPMLEWGNTSSRIFACVVEKFDLTPSVGAFLYRILGRSRNFDYVHVLEATTMSLYVFPAYRFREQPQMMFSCDTFSVWETHESFYYSIYGTWHRAYTRKRYVNPKKLSSKSFVFYSEAEGGGSLYSALWHRNLLIYVPSIKNVEDYLLLFISTLLKMGGTLAVVDGYKDPTATATSYDVCHRVMPSGLCDKYLAHARFCRIVGVPSDSGVFSDPAHMRTATELPLNSIYFQYPEQNDRLLLDGLGEPIWKHFCTVCAYPHRVFGMTVDGDVFCGPEMPWQVSERCVNKQKGCCTRKCAEEYAISCGNQINAVTRYVSHYGGRYDKADSLFVDYETAYVPSFGYQLIYYISSVNSIGALRRCTELSVCTCMLSDVPCDSNKCYRLSLMDKEYTVTTTGAIFSTGDNVIVPPGMKLEDMFRVITSVTIPHRLIQQCYNSHAMSYAGFSLYDYMYTPHVSLQSCFGREEIQPAVT